MSFIIFVSLFVRSFPKSWRWKVPTATMHSCTPRCDRSESEVQLPDPLQQLGVDPETNVSINLSVTRQGVLCLARVECVQTRPTRVEFHRGGSEAARAVGKLSGCRNFCVICCRLGISCRKYLFKEARLESSFSLREHAGVQPSMIHLNSVNCRRVETFSPPR